MFELQVYYHDVLRYTIVANLDKAQELRNMGFHVQVKEAPDLGMKSGKWLAPVSHPTHEQNGTTNRHYDEFGFHELNNVQHDAEHYALGFY